MKKAPKPKYKTLADYGLRPDVPTGNGRKSDRWIEPWWPLLGAFGWDYKRLAEELGVSGQSVWRWASGQGDPTTSARKLIELIAKREKVKSPF